MTPFQECISVLSALKYTISNDLTVFKRYINDDDLKFSLSNKMLIDLVSFLDEWNHFRSLAKEDPELQKTANIAQPALDRIRKWDGIQTMRNTMLAHNFRDKKNKNKLTCLQTRYFSANVPRSYAEIALLSEFAVYAIATVICRHPDDHKEQRDNIPRYHESNTDEIRTLNEFHEELRKLRAALFAKDERLRSCFDS